MAPLGNSVSIPKVTEQKYVVLSFEGSNLYINIYLTLPILIPSRYTFLLCFNIKGWSYDGVLKYFIKSENANVSNADKGYHGHDGLLSVTNVPYRTLVAKAFVDAGSQIGLPIIDVNGEKQVGINYLQVI